MTKRRLALLVVLSMVAMVVTGAVTAQAAPTKPDPKQDKAKLESFWANTLGTNAASAPSANAGTTGSLGGGFKMERLAKAQPDECFYGIGDVNNGPIPATGCPAGSQPKVDQAYVWGLAKPTTTSDLWFGTAPNVHCLVMGGYLGMTDPIKTDSYVCEFGSTNYKLNGTITLPAAIGDWRPPQIFTYNISTKKLTEKTLLVVNHDSASALRLNTTVGLRSAGTLGNVVFLAGPGMQGGINLFAFNTQTGECLGSTNLSGYTNIRKWLVVDGVLYTGVASANGEGHILRWMGGTASGYDTPNLFTLAEVGQVGSDAAELAVHEGRIFVATWPGSEIAGGGSTAGLYMSPPIPEGGFTPASATSWTKVWGAEQYEPDLVTAATYGGGALASYGGYLYWGTMHVPFLAGEANLQFYSDYYGSNPTQEQTVAAFLGTHRAISIFRGRNFTDANPKGEEQVVYGESSLPAFAPATGWTLQPTKMGTPLYGSSGFGNFFNNYTWSMAVYNNKLFVGTMDWSYLANDLLKQFVGQETGQPLNLPVAIPKGNFGADLWAFKSSSGPASPISQDGVGNYTSYGIRTTVVDGVLYLGMANPMNLLTNLKDKIPEGGWELIKVTGR
jgi:hypothetical protein